MFKYLTQHVLFIQEMDKATRQTCYEGITIQDFKIFIKRSREHEVILHREFNR